MALLTSFRALGARVVLGAVLACAGSLAGLAQPADKPAAAPDAPSHNEARPPPGQDTTGTPALSDPDTPASAPPPRCRLQNDKKLDLIV